MPVPASKKIPKISEEKVGAKLEEKLGHIRKGEIEKEAELKAKALGVPYINLKGFAISPEALAIIPEEQAKKMKVVCFLYTGPEIRLGAIDPQNEEVQELLHQMTERFHSQGDVYLITEESCEQALKLYEILPKVKKVIKGVEITEEDLEKFKKIVADFKDLQNEINKVNITDMVALALATGLKLGASDIHIEAEEKDIKVRLRIDGVLQDAAKIDRKNLARLISRIKLVSGLKINITDKPQDGRLTIFVEGEETDVRVSTIPTAYGESVVMRILSKKAIKLEFDDLGITGTAFEKLKREVQRPNGMIITTGPTGSGKTTTLYAILKKLNKPGVKIITLEDPVEYRLEGINQSQINHAKDYTFAKGLRSILRQDPDIIMVGEIRDLETADIAINASLTGHLVISTIHTNTAAGAIPRFLAMGAKGFLLAPALNAVVGQRLVRRICKECKAEDKLDADTLARVKESLESIPENSGVKVDMKNLKFHKGKGCEKCNKLGYKGRIGVYEIFIMNKEIEKVILSEEISEYKILEIAQAQGMLTMAQDGLLKALEGITSVEEVFRVTE